MIPGEDFTLAGDQFGKPAHLLPAEKMAGVVAADVLAILTIVLLCFLAGLFVGTRIGRRLSERR